MGENNNNFGIHMHRICVYSDNLEQKCIDLNAVYCETCERYWEYQEYSIDEYEQIVKAIRGVLIKKNFERRLAR